jgi:dsRNA-specific ribonuclease
VLKSRLVANTTLCELSRCYGLHHFPRFRAHPHQSAILANNGVVRAALFEAYCAALKDHYGREKTLDWLKLVLSPLAKKAYEVMKEGNDQAKQKKQSAAAFSGAPVGGARFVSYVSLLEEWRMRGGRGKKVVYEKRGTRGPPHQPIHVGVVLVEGKQLGEEEGPVWQDVKHRLAYSALKSLGVSSGSCPGLPDRLETS